MKDLNVKIEGFEGPLDLLLHLIQQYEVDIYEVPLAEVTDQYLAYVKTMQTLQLEVAAEYLVMAATLLAIKSRQLLPAITEDEPIFEEEENLEDNLLQQLLTYRKYKYAAEKLQEKEGFRKGFFDKEPSDLSGYVKEMPLAKNQVTTIDLFLAFHDVLQKKKIENSVGATIEKETETVSEKVHWLKKYLQKNPGQIPFSSLFVSVNKSDVVNTFLALLELLKEGAISAFQGENFAEIMLVKGEVDG